MADFAANAPNPGTACSTGSNNAGTATGSLSGSSGTSGQQHGAKRQGNGLSDSGPNKVQVLAGGSIRIVSNDHENWMAELDAREKALKAWKAGLKAEQAGLVVMKEGLEARQAGLVAREEGITAREEGVKDKEKAVVAREEAVVAREEAVEAGEESLKTGKMDLEGNWFDYADRKMKLDKRDHDCSALDDLKHTLKLMDDAAEHSGVRPGRVKNQHKAQQSLTVLTALKDSLVQQVRHLLANDAGLDLTIWLDHVDAMEDDLEEMGDFDFQRISKKDITSLKDELVKDVRNLLEYDAMIFHRP